MENFIIYAKLFTKKYFAGLHNEEFQGARIANQIILASKCHAIRDAQLTEKVLIKKQLEDENRRFGHLIIHILIYTKDTISVFQNGRNNGTS